MGKILQVIQSRERDLGGFSVRRILPHPTHRMVGPFLFFDHMGPANFPAGRGIDVRPHPHIHLATVTYLFEGKIRHRDSLGSDKNIEPGAINWMTAGRGIVHSERAPDDFLQHGGRLNGIQLWVALPKESENSEPAFTHVPASEIPEWRVDSASLRLLLGTSSNRKNPAPVHSDLFYIEAIVPKGAKLPFSSEAREFAAYLVTGRAKIVDKVLSPFEMAVFSPDTSEIFIEAEEDSRIMLLGGKSVGPRYMFWNFVSSEKENLVKAAKDWAAGPGEKSSRFPKVPGDDLDFIPLPENERP